MPVGAISGIGPVTVKRLSVLGITNVGELQDAPLPALEAAHVRPYADGGAHALLRRAAPSRRHHRLVRRRLRHRHARPPLPRQPRPRRRLPESLARGGHRIKGDETFLTLYAFVSQMDIAGGLYVRAHGASSSLCGAVAPATLADDVTTTLWQCAWWPCMLSNT